MTTKRTAAEAMELIAAGDGEAVAENLDKFEGLNTEVALALIAAGAECEFDPDGLDIWGGWDVAENLDKFDGLDYHKVAEALIATWDGEAVATFLGSFKGLNHAETARALIWGGYGLAVAQNLENFEGLNHTEVVQELLCDGPAISAAVAQNLEKFEGLNYAETAQALIAAGAGEAVAWNLDKFFERILVAEPDALAAARYLAQGARERAEVVTVDEFLGMLQAARSVAVHEPAVREVQPPAHTL